LKPLRIHNTDFYYLFSGSRPPPRQQETLSRKKRPQRQLLDTFSEDTVGCPSLESTRIQASATAVKNPLASPPPTGLGVLPVPSTKTPAPSTKTPVPSTKTPVPSTKTPEQLENDRLFDALLGEAVGPIVFLPAIFQAKRLRKKFLNNTARFFCESGSSFVIIMLNRCFSTGVVS
jgi:hypothetical protein